MEGSSGIVSNGLAKQNKDSRGGREGRDVNGFQQQERLVRWGGSVGSHVMSLLSTHSSSRALGRSGRAVKQFRIHMSCVKEEGREGIEVI